MTAVPPPPPVPGPPPPAPPSWPGPPLSAGPQPPPAPPRDVRIASSLLFALGGVLAFNAALALIYHDEIVRSADDQMDAYLSPSTVNTVVLVAGVLLLALGALLILAGLHVRRGRQWARVLAFTVAGIVIPFAGIGALAGGGFLAVLMFGGSVGVVAFLMQSAVAPFFAGSHRG